MGGQGVERREILRYIGIASVGLRFPGSIGGRSPVPTVMNRGRRPKPLLVLINRCFSLRRIIEWSSISQR